MLIRGVVCPYLPLPLIMIYDSALVERLSRPWGFLCLGAEKAGMHTHPMMDIGERDSDIVRVEEEKQLRQQGRSS